MRHLLCRGERDDPALAMPQQPEALGPGRSARRANPACSVGDIIGDHDRIGVRHRRLTGEHAALVDPQCADAALGQRVGEQAIGRRSHSQRIVSIAVGRARTRDDQDQRLPFGGRDQRSGEIASWPGGNQRFLGHCGRSAHRCQQGPGAQPVKHCHLIPPSLVGRAWAASKPAPRPRALPAIRAAASRSAHWHYATRSQQAVRSRRGPPGRGAGRKPSSSSDRGAAHGYW